MTLKHAVKLRRRFETREIAQMQTTISKRTRRVGKANVENECENWRTWQNCLIISWTTHNFVLISTYTGTYVLVENHFQKCLNLQHLNSHFKNQHCNLKNFWLENSNETFVQIFKYCEKVGLRDNSRSNNSAQMEYWTPAEYFSRCYTNMPDWIIHNEVFIWF